MNLTSALRRAALVRPTGLAIVSGETRITWLEEVQRISRLAGGLRAHGVVPGSRVATLAFNSPMYFELLMAIWWAGGVLVPLNTRLSVEEINYILSHSDPCLLISDDDLSELASASSNGLVQHLRLDAKMLDTLIASDPLEASRSDLASAAGIFYTGGTTGLPKGVELSHMNLAFAARNMQRDLGHDENTVYLHAAPMFHLADFGIGLGVTLAAGGHSFMARFTAEDFYERLREDSVTHLQLVPTMLASVLDAPCRDDQLLSRIKRISYGAAPISTTLLERTLAAFPQAKVHQFYGMTESAGASVMLPPERHVLNGSMSGKLLSAGQVTTGFEIRIANDAEESLPVGHVGEIQIRGPAVMTGYWKDPDQTAKTIVDGWLRSGDGGYLDEDGFLFVVDRIKDMIISGGENIYCAEVESALASHPSVHSCAVLGLPDEHWGERVHAAVVLMEGKTVTEEELIAHCRNLLAGYKIPRSYNFFESLPLSGVGKVQKKTLRELCLAQRNA